MNHYGRRDIESLGEYYTRHAAAMTREQLCSKSDIAAELAYRDKLIDELSGHLQKGDKDEKSTWIFDPEIKDELERFFIYDS